MKQKKERKKWKGLKTRYLLMGIVALMIASSQTVCAEEINWQKATEIAKRYVTLPQDDGMKAKENGRKNKAGIPYYIYNDARGQGFVIVSGDSSSFEVPLYSYWLRKSNLPWTDDHTYLFRVMGEIGGKEVELKNPQEPSYYLKRKGDILILYQDTATGIENATTSDVEADISREGQQFLVSGKGVRKIKLYNAGGNLVRQASGTDVKPVSLSLQGIRQGVYLLRVETGMQSKTYKLLL